MNEKVKELLEELKDGAENPTVIYPTFDGSDEEKFENDKLLTPESCKLLFNYITKLQNNWNGLKKWLKEEHKININWYETLTPRDKGYYLFRFGVIGDVLDNVQDKMQELEGENNNEEKSNCK